MSEWRNCLIGDVAEIIGGGTPSTTNKENYGGDISWITPKDLSGHKEMYISKGERSITRNGLENSSARLLPVNSILFTSRAPIGYIALAKNELSTNQGFKSLILKADNNPKFFYYLLKQITPKIESYASGSTFEEISGNFLSKIPIKIPTSNVQKKIGEFIETFDKKIELNKQTNINLENIAASLFKSWFIDFDPVKAKVKGHSSGLPNQISDLFPNSFEKTELGDVPYGWEICTLGDLVDLEKKAVTPNDSPKEIFYHYSIPAYDEGMIPSQDIGNSIKSNKFLITKGVFMISKLNPSLPRFWLPSISNSKRSISSTEFLVCRPKEIVGIPYAYYLTKSSKILRQMKSMATGTSSSHQRLRPIDFSSITSIRPNKKLFDVYSGYISPILEKLLLNREQNIILSSYRDSLIPKLITGELEISDIEKKVKEVDL